MELRIGLMAEIAGLEGGVRIYEQRTHSGKTDVSEPALMRLQLRLKQVEALIASFER